MSGKYTFHGSAIRVIRQEFTGVIVAETHEEALRLAKEGKWTDIVSHEEVSVLDGDPSFDVAVDGKGLWHDVIDGELRIPESEETPRPTPRVVHG